VNLFFAHRLQMSAGLRIFAKSFPSEVFLQRFDCVVAMLVFRPSACRQGGVATEEQPKNNRRTALLDTCHYPDKPLPYP